MRIVPADATIADLEKKALEYDLLAKDQSEPEATSFKKLAALCRNWIAALNRTEMERCCTPFKSAQAALFIAHWG